MLRIVSDDLWQQFKELLKLLDAFPIDYSSVSFNGKKAPQISLERFNGLESQVKMVAGVRNHFYLHR